MKLFNVCVAGFLLIQSCVVFGQGEAVENAYLSDVHVFSRIPLDTLWDYFPKGRVDFGHLPTKAAWSRANPTFLQDDTGKPLPWSGIGWFQQKFTVPDSLNGETIAMRIGHLGASEIYVDGKFICRFGDVLATSGNDKSYLPRKPFPVTLANEPVHVLTVRYASHDFDKVIQPRIFFGFCFAIAPLSESYLPTSITTYHGIFSMSLYISFTLLFFFLYLFYPQRLGSLFTALYLLNFSVLFTSILIATTTTDASVGTWSNLLWKSAVASVGGWSLLFIYSIYYRKIPRRGWLVAVLMIVNLYVVIYPSLSNPVLTVLNIIIALETWRITFLGVRNKHAGFWILAIGQFLGTVFFVLFIGDLFRLFSPLYSSFSIVREIGGLLSDLSSPLMFSLQLAWEFGSSNRNLKEQLGEVQKLSTENLAQEIEKQQLLATQNERLEQQVDVRTAELKASQAQLIQKEKLASLGELTAGIAHEIQNPLNFVNNFSEVSAELVDELEEELDRGDAEEAKAIAGDLRQNLQKIHHHGSRASGIVRGMLEHSRTGTGEKQPANLNALADEYLKIAYHGQRAKDNSFNAELVTDFDGTLPQPEVIPQEIGRVLLNLYNNAFYAVNQKQKTVSADYHPVVTVTTAQVNGHIEIRVADNGMGIPDAVKAKIFQPFFTTKPTGEGTGLGLSLSYDIITKGHGGTLLVESREEQGTEFVIQLPTATVGASV